MCNRLKLVAAGAAVVVAGSLWTDRARAGVLPVVPGSTDDYVILEFTSGNPPGQPTYSGPPVADTNPAAGFRVGASSDRGGRNPVYIFSLPVLPAGESVSSADFAFQFTGKSNTPTFNADLWGIGFQAGSTPLVEYYEGPGPDAENTKVQEDILMPTTATGTVSTSAPAGETALGAYLQSFYATNPTYSGGSFAFLRLSPDSASIGNNIVGYNISSADFGTPTLTITTVPEPTALGALAVLGVAAVRRRPRRRARG